MMGQNPKHRLGNSFISMIFYILRNYANDWHDRDFIEMMLQSILYKTKSSVAAIIPVRTSSTKEVAYYYDPNFSRGVFCTEDINLKYIDLEGFIVQDLKKLI